MKFDLQPILESWPFDGEEPANNYRKIKLPDGRTVIQVREPLGVQQMEYDGRPDGDRPEGQETWLEYYRTLAAHDPSLKLAHEDCLRLMQEGILFYQRYLILYQMDDWAGVLRDTARNLEYFDLCRARAEHAEDSLTIEQYRPYLLRMNSIARAHLLWAAEKRMEAIESLDRTRVEIAELERVNSPVFDMERDKALKHLEQQIAEFRKAHPEAKIELLRQRQREAVLAEDFETAARLRDEIRALEGEFVSKN